MSRIARRKRRFWSPGLRDVIGSGCGYHTIGVSRCGGVELHSCNPILNICTHTHMNTCSTPEWSPGHPGQMVCGLVCYLNSTFPKHHQYLLVYIFEGSGQRLNTFPGGRLEEVNRAEVECRQMQLLKRVKPVK